MNQKGAAIIFSAVMMAGLLAFSGAAIDIGLMLHQRTRMQAAADSAALAGAKALTKSGIRATYEAIAVAGTNGYTIDASNVTIPTPTKVRVAMSAPAGMILKPFFNLFDIRIGVASAAEFTPLPGGGGCTPIGVPKKDFVPGKEYPLKPGTGSPNNHGNFAPLVFDCRGANNYQQHIETGSNIPIKVGQYYYTETGNMVGPTQKGFENRIGNDQTSLEDSIEKGSPRLVILPLIDNGWWEASTGTSPQLIVGFARFYVTYSAKGEVHGRFVDYVQQAEISPAGSQYAVKLVE